MSFKIAHFLSSLIGLTVALLFIFVGIVCFMLPLFPPVRFALSTFILDDSPFIFFFGLCFLIIGIAYITAMIFDGRRKYYHLKTGPAAISISETVFQDYLNSYWKKVFPQNEVPCTIKIRQNKVHITADLPFVPLKDQRTLIERMQEDVTRTFNRLIGYQSEYIFSLSFKESSKSD